MTWLDRLLLRFDSTDKLRAERLHVLTQKELAHRVLEGAELKAAIERLNAGLGAIDVVLHRRRKM